MADYYYYKHEYERIGDKAVPFKHVTTENGWMVLTRMSKDFRGEDRLSSDVIPAVDAKSLLVKAPTVIEVPYVVSSKGFVDEAAKGTVANLMLGFNEHGRLVKAEVL